MITDKSPNALSLSWKTQSFIHLCFCTHTHTQYISIYSTTTFPVHPHWRSILTSSVSPTISCSPSPDETDAQNATCLACCSMLLHYHYHLYQGKISHSWRYTKKFSLLFSCRYKANQHHYNKSNLEGEIFSLHKTGKSNHLSWLPSRCSGYYPP